LKVPEVLITPLVNSRVTQSILKGPEPPVRNATPRLVVYAVAPLIEEEPFAIWPGPKKATSAANRLWLMLKHRTSMDRQYIRIREIIERFLRRS
jgi:hypothetical protein